ncbi:MAG: flavodoxin [Breznakibacter sp.]
MKIAVLYGSSLGNTQFVAEKIHSFFPDALLASVSELNVGMLSSFDLIVLGTSTWGVGDMQDDFGTFVSKLLLSDLEGKTFALFGLGDQHNYPDTFCNGMGKLYHLLENMEVRFVGQWPIDGYDYSESEAVIDRHFVGLAIDEENEPDLTDGRVTQWCRLLMRQFEKHY